MTSPDRRIVFITAAAGEGLGQAIARRFARDGETVVVTDVHPRRTDEVVESLSAEYLDAKVVGRVLDVGNPMEIASTVQSVLNEFGRVDVLVNNAAVNVVGTIFDIDPAAWDRTLAVNLSGPWHLCRGFMPSMRERGGVIVNVSAVAAELGGSGIEGVYAITKAGMNALTRSCAHEGGRFGIRAVSLGLGLMSDTRYVRQHPEILDYDFTQPVLSEHPTTDAVADVVAFLCSPSARHITGEVIGISSGLYMRP